MYIVQKQWSSFIHPFVVVFICYYYNAFMNGRGITASQTMEGREAPDPAVIAGQVRIHVDGYSGVLFR